MALKQPIAGFVVIALWMSRPRGILAYAIFLAPAYVLVAALLVPRSELALLVQFLTSPLSGVAARWSGGCAHLCGADFVRAAVPYLLAFACIGLVLDFVIGPRPQSDATNFDNAPNRAATGISIKASGLYLYLTFFGVFFFLLLGAVASEFGPAESLPRLARYGDGIQDWYIAARETLLTYGLLVSEFCALDAFMQIVERRLGRTARRGSSS